MVAHACNTSTAEGRKRGSEVQDHCQLCIEFEINLSYLKPYPQKTKAKQNLLLCRNMYKTNQAHPSMGLFLWGKIISVLMQILLCFINIDLDKGWLTSGKAVNSTLVIAYTLVAIQKSVSYS